MIRLRSSIIAALRHPLLGPFVLLLLACVLVLVVLHVPVEIVVSAAIAFCGTVALVFASGSLLVSLSSAGSRRAAPTTLARPPTRLGGSPPPAAGARSVLLRL